MSPPSRLPPLTGCCLQAAADRVAAFKRTVDRCHGRIQELKSYTDSLFQGIFAHRFRWVGMFVLCWAEG